MAIVGAGIIGTAIAREIKKNSNAVKTILIEKESSFGKHQSSHNSGVIHSGKCINTFEKYINFYFLGVYYKPNSLKAKLCVNGADYMYEYCRDNNIPYNKCGKLIVATEYYQIDILKELYERGTNNGSKGLNILCNLEQIIEIEPKAKGIHALWCPNSGNVDFLTVTESFGKDFRKAGGDVLLNNEVSDLLQTKIGLLE